MLGTLAQFARQVRRPALATVAVAAMVLPALSTSSFARGPDGISDVAERVIDAVVNISTSQKVEARNTPMPQLPNDPQLDELFKDFFNRRGQNDPQNRERGPRRVNSLGSGFVIDATGIVVTNNHVIAEADEITVILNDGTRLKAELLGKDQKTDLALLRVKPDKPLKAVKFGDSDRRLHQSGQFGRPAVQSRRRGGWGQHRDHLSVGRIDRYRICGALEDGAAGDRSIEAVR
jgi:serine protease Do